MNQAIYIKYFWEGKDIIQAHKYHHQSSTIQIILNLIYPILGISYIILGLYEIHTEHNNSVSTIILGSFILCPFEAVRIRSVAQSGTNKKSMFDLLPSIVPRGL